jgi:hypothetical protein
VTDGDDRDRREGEPPAEEEDLGEFDYVDPLKRDPDDTLPGLDPIVPSVPPES